MCQHNSKNKAQVTRHNPTTKHLDLGICNYSKSLEMGVVLPTGIHRNSDGNLKGINQKLALGGSALLSLEKKGDHCPQFRSVPIMVSYLQIYDY